jgi:hypothetical protein
MVNGSNKAELTSSGPLSARELLVRGNLGYRFRKAGTVTIFVVAAVIVVAAVALSPFALRVVDRKSNLNWTTLSDIGQAYGGAASVLSGLAICGVALSLLVQHRESRITLEQIRIYHLELVRMGLEYPQIQWVKISAGVDEYPGREMSEIRLQQFQYINLWINYWMALHRLGNLSTQEVRTQFAETVFNTEVGRDHWRHYRKRLRTSFRHRRDLLFFRVVDAEYQMAVESGPPRFGPDEQGSDLVRAPKRRSTKYLAWLALMLGGAVVAHGCRIFCRRGKVYSKDG